MKIFSFSSQDYKLNDRIKTPGGYIIDIHTVFVLKMGLYLLKLYLSRIFSLSQNVSFEVQR